MNPLELIQNRGQLGTSPFSTVVTAPPLGGSRTPVTYPGVVYNPSPVYTPTPAYNPVYNPSPIVTTGPAQPASSSAMSVFNTTASLVSQILAGFSRNPTNQVTAGGVGVIQNPNVQISQAQANAAVGIAQTQAGRLTTGSALGGSAGSALGGGLDGIIAWATANPVIVFAAIAGVYLLMRQPPGRR